MKYSCKLRFYCNAKAFYNAFLPELEKQNRQRAKFSIKKNRNNIEFDIEANDSVALRATLNRITTLFTVCEKMQETK